MFLPSYWGTKVGLLLVHGSSFGQMPFLPPPVTPMGSGGIWTQVCWVQIHCLNRWAVVQWLTDTLKTVKSHKCRWVNATGILLRQHLASVNMLLKVTLAVITENMINVPYVVLAFSASTLLVWLQEGHPAECCCCRIWWWAVSLAVLVLIMLTVKQIGSNTSGVYRVRLTEQRYVFIQTNSKLFKNPLTNQPEFIMSTHSIIRWEPYTAQQHRGLGDVIQDTITLSVTCCCFFTGMV